MLNIMIRCLSEELEGIRCISKVLRWLSEVIMLPNKGKVCLREKLRCLSEGLRLSRED
jgi:hypothetical protein